MIKVGKKEGKERNDFVALGREGALGLTHNPVRAKGACG